ncbi:PUA-like domain-containing protein [Melampsora americana]|nr:PUA-like domain-containing protein [Melampsora americana]
MTNLSYEEIRQRNIDSNRQLLLSLKLSGPTANPIIPKTQKTKTDQTSKKPKTKKTKINEEEESNVLDDQTNSTTRRRSGRIQKIILSKDEDYQKSSDESSSSEEEEEENVKPNPRKRKSTGTSFLPTRRPRQSGPPRRKARSLTAGRPNPKIFGHQIGVEVGDWWDARMSCSQAGVHAPPVSGIAGNETDGCWSVALSGGYEDDVDLGYAFTYTGAGGRALSGTAKNPKNLRTAPQTFDQEFTSLNAALRTSTETKNPVRVIRGYKNHSPFAPEEGYRYDGLYVVERAWREVGQAGFQVCKFAFVRLPGQPKIPVKEGREAEAAEMYKDMGFIIDELPSSPEARPVWSKKAAQARMKGTAEVKEDGSGQEMEADGEDKEDVVKGGENEENEVKSNDHKEDEVRGNDYKEDEVKSNDHKEDEVKGDYHKGNEVKVDDHKEDEVKVDEKEIETANTENSKTEDKAEDNKGEESKVDDDAKLIDMAIEIRKEPPVKTDDLEKVDDGKVQDEDQSSKTIKTLEHTPIHDSNTRTSESKPESESITPTISDHEGNVHEEKQLKD